MAQTKLKDVEINGDDDRVVHSICLAASSYVLLAAISSAGYDKSSSQFCPTKKGSEGSKKGDRGFGV